MIGCLSKICSTGCLRKIDTAWILCSHGTCRNIQKLFKGKLSPITSFRKLRSFLKAISHNKIFILNHFKNFSEFPIFYHCAKNWPLLNLVWLIQNENFIMQMGYEENFCFYEFFWLSSQILDFTLWTKSTVVEFTKG